MCEESIKRALSRRFSTRHTCVCSEFVASFMPMPYHLTQREPFYVMNTEDAER